MFRQSISAIPGDRTSVILFWCLSVVLAALIFLFDLQLPLGVAGGVPYVAVVLVAWWLPHRRNVLALAVITSLLTAAGYVMSPPGGSTWIVLSNRGLALFVIWSVAILVIQRKPAEAMLREARDKLELEVAERTRELGKLSIAIEQSPLSIVITDLTGAIEYVNPQFTNVSGYTFEEVVGENPRILNSGQNDHEIYEDMWRTLLDGRTWRGDLLNSKKNGELLWETVNISPINSAEGKITHFVGVKEDISERKQMEKILRESEQRLTATLDASPIGVSIVDKDGNSRFVNRRIADMLGVAQAALIDKPVRTHYAHPEDREVLLSEFQETGSVVDNEIELLRSDGAPFWVLMTMMPTEHDGQPALMAWVYDITERKLAEEVLAGQKAVIEAVLVNMDQGVVMYGEDMAVTVFNDMARELMRFPEDVLFNGAKLSDINKYARSRGDPSTGNSPDETTERWEALKGGAAHSFEYVHSDGTVIEIRRSPVPEGGFVVTQTDVTERKKFEREIVESRDAAEAATKAKAEFLANMSHEIRTPMNAIIGLSNLALETELSDKQKDYLTKIEGSGKALLGIINDILDFSKIEAGKLTMEEIAFDLHSDVLENLSSVIGMKAAEQGLELLYDFDADLPSALVGDPLRLGQVLINLGNNSLNVTEQGEITLGIDVTDMTHDRVSLHVEIRDTGIGMTKEQTDKLFQAFSQADSTTTRKFGGTGLGLTISKSLVELMDGEIGVVSEAGKGSTFWFTARFGRASEEAIKERRQLDVDLKGLKVLVVDDNPTARTILSRYLLAFEYEVSEAGSGEEAIGILETAPDNSQFDLVLMDWKMPRMDGLEATRRIKSDDKLATVPAVLMVTAYDRQQLEEEASETKHEGILLKPVSQSSLLDGILAAFGKELGIRERRQSQSLPHHCLGARILLVEDNNINQQVATEILEKAGCEITLAVDGREGVKAAQERPDYYDCILMDIQMPVLDGYGATKEIRGDDRLLDIPIIAMTANAFSSDRDQALEAGMVDHVAKPIEVRDLFDVMGQWITVPEERRGNPVGSSEIVDEDQIELPEISGIDTVTGIERLGGNVGLYLSLLQDFIQQQGASDESVRKALSDGDLVLAEREAHTVKGVAANLGIDTLQTVAGELETAIPGADDTVVYECLERFAVVLSVSVSSVQSALADGSDLFGQTEEAHGLSNVNHEDQMSRIILVAEDSTINQKIIGRQLTMVGYECEMAEDGKVALEMLAKQSYGLLMTDLSMPEIDGYELATAVRNQEAEGEIRLPIIAIAGTLTEAEIERCMSVGMDDCLAKPIDMEKLKEMLNEHLPESSSS